MPRKLAIKRLSESDLTFFEYHHRRTAGKQKAINLNADVFIDELYPQLPDIAQQHAGRFPVDFYIYGPGMKGEYNLQRKITKRGTYKNWRLNGEFIHDPLGDERRFAVLQAGDFAVLEFIGEITPDICKAVFVAASVAEDQSLNAEIARFMAGADTMRRIDETALSQLVQRAAVAEAHPANNLLLVAPLEDAAFYGEQGTQELLRRQTVVRISQTALDRARRRAEEAGEIGEAFVNAYLNGRQQAGELVSYFWASQDNAVCPYDFSCVESNGANVELDAKSTQGEFERAIHISLSELRRMATSAARYDLYRVYDMRGQSAKLRIATDLRQFAAGIVSAFGSLPYGVTVDSVSVNPSELGFGPEISLSLPEDE